MSDVTRGKIAFTISPNPLRPITQPTASGDRISVDQVDSPAVVDVPVASFARCAHRLAGSRAAGGVGLCVRRKPNPSGSVAQLASPVPPCDRDRHTAGSRDSRDGHRTAAQRFWRRTPCWWRAAPMGRRRWRAPRSTTPRLAPGNSPAGRTHHPLHTRPRRTSEGGRQPGYAAFTIPLMVTVGVEPVSRRNSAVVGCLPADPVIPYPERDDRRAWCPSRKPISVLDVQL
jgi:hypothetical protein